MAFQGAGFATFAATSVHILGPTWTEGIDRGVDRFDAVAQAKRMGERTAAAFENWLSGHASEPFFAWIHLFDPHAPYEPVKRYDRAYLERLGRDRPGSAANLDDVPTYLEDVRRWLAEITDPRVPAAQYAAQVSYSDEVVGRLLEALALYGCADDTVVAVTADHGECLGEHGVYYNHFGLFEEVVRVPLILALPPRWCREPRHPVMRRAWNLPATWRGGGMVRQRRIASPVMTVDLFPTLLELAGIDSDSPVDGSSLVALVRGERKGFQRLVVAEHTDLAQVMLVSGPWKYVRSLSDLSYAPSYSITRGEEAVYRLDRAFGETRCTPSEAAPILEAFRAAADTIASERASADRATPLGMDAAMVAQLQALGYF